MSQGFNLKIRPISFKSALASKSDQPVSNQLSDCACAKESQPVERPKQPESTVPAPAKGLLTRMGTGIKKLAEVADDIDKIRNAVEGVYKLARAIWPVLLMMWPN